MAKVLLDRYEALTHSTLEPVCAQHAARIFAKVRLADVLPIQGSGISPREFRFALQSHFDFVVTDAAHESLFAVEYDGASHGSLTQVARDKLKNQLCERFHFPLLRINSRYLEANFRGFDLLTWFVEVWFTARAFENAQQAGSIPRDEAFDALSVLHLPGRTGIFPLWLGHDQIKLFRLAHQRGELYDWGPSEIVGVDERGDYRAIAFIRTAADSAIYSKTGMRAQNFDIAPSEILGDLVLFDLWRRFQEVIDGRRSAQAVAEVQRVINHFRESTRLCRASIVGPANEMDSHWSRSA